MAADASTRCDELVERDRTVLASIRSNPDERKRIGQELFFAHFADVERTVRARLCDRGVGYSDQMPHYNDIFDHIVRRIYGADALLQAVADYQLELGRLDHWLLRRVGYEVSDWLKRHVPGPDRMPGEDFTAEGDNILANLDNSIDFEAILGELTELERASVALLLVAARDLNDGDLEAIESVSGKPPEEVLQELESLAGAGNGEISQGERETQLVSQLSFWSHRLHRSELRQRAFRRHLERVGHPAGEIAEIENRAEQGDQTQEAIRVRYRKETEAFPSRREAIRLKREFELACHAVVRARQRLAGLRDEYQRLPPVPLSPHESIAKTLNTGRSHVTSALYRGRKRLMEAGLFKAVTESSVRKCHTG